MCIEFGPMILEMLDKRIADLKDAKVCVQKSQGRPELQACRAKVRGERRERIKIKNNMERKD